MSMSTTDRKRLVRTSVRRALLATAASFALGSAAMAVPSGEPKPFDIGGQPLNSALGEFARQSNRQILYSTEVVLAKRTGGVKGELSAESALKMLLQGTGLTFRVTADDTILVERIENRATASWQPTADHALRLAQADTAAAEPADEEKLSEVVVTGISFQYNDVESANKMNLSVKDTPQSVKVITEDLLDFAGIRKFEDAYKIDAGSQTSNAQDGWVRTYFRGFQLDYDKAIKIDGIRTPGQVAPDLSPFERFEIIKGSTSTIYGQSQIAGTLNAVSKKPRSDFGGSLSFETGSFSHYMAEADVYGALTSDGKLSSRLVTSYLDEDTFLDYGFSKRLVIAPSLKYEFTPDTSLTLLTQYQDMKFNASYGYGAQYTGPVGTEDEEAARNDPNNYGWPDVPRSRLVGFPDANPKRKLMFGRALLEHHFASDWQMRTSVQYTKSDVKNKGAYSGGVEPDGQAPLYMYFDDGGGEAYSGEVNLFGSVELGGREHTLFFGADYSHDKYGRFIGYGLLGPDAFNIYDPDYASLPKLPSEVAPYLDLNTPGYVGGVLRERTLYQETGVTLQTILHPVDRLSVLLGARYSDFKLSTISNCCDETALEPLPSGFGDDRYEDNALTYQLGTTFAITPKVNAYASYGETFLPRNELIFNAADPSNGTRTNPEEGTSYEVGLKGEARERRFSWSVAAFKIERTNISESDVNHPGFVLLRGKQRSKGVEVDFQGEVMQGWNVFGSLATIDNEFVEGEFKGFPSFLAPRFGASFYTSYEFQHGPWAGFGFGGGMVYKLRGQVRQFDDPGHGLYFDRLFGDIFEMDARVFYNRNNWTFQLSALNLLDTKYYSPVYNTFLSSVSVNPPRTIFGKVSYDLKKK